MSDEEFDWADNYDWTEIEVDSVDFDDDEEEDMDPSIDAQNWEEIY